MKIKFKGEWHTISSHPEDNSLFNVTDIYRIAGGDRSQKFGNFNRGKNISGLAERLGKELNVVVGRGRGSSSYACKEVLFAYVAWLGDREFIEAVEATFTSAVKGNGQEAVAHASSVVVDDEAVQKEKKLRKQMIGLAGRKKAEGSITESNPFKILNRVVSKAVSGDLPRAIRDNHGSAFKAIMAKVEEGDSEAVEMAAITVSVLETIIKCLNLDLSIKQTCGMLNVDYKEVIE